MRCGPLLCLLFPITLSGCAGSLAHNAWHPDRQFFDQGDYQIVVLKQPNGWSSWYQSKSMVSLVPDLKQLEAVQVRAIEQASGCRVTDRYRVLNNQPAYLVAAVDCAETPALR